MNGLTTVGNPEMVKLVSGLFFVFITTYKFTEIVYRFFNERENRK